MRTPAPSNKANNALREMRCATALLHKLRRGLRACLVVGNAKSEQLHQRLYRDTIGYTIATHRRRSIGLANDQCAVPGDAANARSTNSTQSAIETTQTAEPGARPDGHPKPPPSAGNHGLGRPGADNLTAADIRLILHNHRPAESTRESWAPPGPAASAQDGELIPRLRWLLTEAAGTVANVAHELETRAVEVDDDAREQLQDDLLVLDEELATVRTLLGAGVDWDAEFRRLLAGKIQPCESDADDHGE